jgi:uncharacterized membrane protein (UPF0127 family)
MMRRAAAGLALVALLAAPLSAQGSGPRRPVVVLAERVRVSVDIVDTPLLRMRGLSGRPALAPEDGMLFLFETPRIQSFWMKDMLFEIDILWIRDGRIVGITPNLPLPKSPRELPQFASPVPCDVVLEVRAGAAKHWGLLLGDSVRIER